MWGSSQAGCPTPALQDPQPVLLTRHPVLHPAGGWAGKGPRLTGQNQDTGLAQHTQLLSSSQGSLHIREVGSETY